MSTTTMSLSVSYDQLAAYDEAAAASGTTRHSWARIALMVAAGIKSRPRTHLQAPAVRGGARRRVLSKDALEPRPIQMGLRITQIEREAIRESALSALIPISRWCVLVLDRAAGISDFAAQLARLG